MKISFLDLAPVIAADGASDALHNTARLAQTAENVGLNRYWLAEHHNMPGIASSATSVLLSYLGSQTSRIRLGSGGIMLPNHAPLVVAEQFGTLAALYGERFDLGLGRAPGTDGATFAALRRTMGDAERFPQDVQELMGYFTASDQARVKAVPAMGFDVPIWILGSSLFGAQLAAALGLPYVFASHFAPQMLMQAVTVYRENFRPSAQLDQPYVMVAANLLLADRQRDAEYHFTSVQQGFVNLRRGRPSYVPAPVEDMDAIWTPAEHQMVDSALSVSFVGDTTRVRERLASFLDYVKPDELIVTANVHDIDARVHSLELVPALALFDLNTASPAHTSTADAA